MFDVPRLLVSAAHKSSGKTVFVTGLCAELVRRGWSVYPFKKGPDYIDPKWLATAAQRSCYNLDFNTQTPDEIVSLFVRQSALERRGDVFFGDSAFVRRDDTSRGKVSQEGSGTLAIIEANKGLYDGVSPDGSDSNAALAKLLRAPVILVIDCEGMTRGIAPLLRGYLDFDPEVSIGGVVLNKVGGDRHAGKLETAVKQYTDIPVVGCLPSDQRMRLPERHLGLIPSNEYQQSAERVEAMRKAVAESVDLEKITGIAHTFTDGDDRGGCTGFVHLADPSFDKERPVSSVSTARGKESSSANPVRTREKTLGVFFDAAFSFYYPDDLSALTRAGFKLVAIDALCDSRLPEMDALFIGGGFPETHAAALESNVSLRTAVRDAVENGLPAYAECGGLMYLSRGIEWLGRRYSMAGVIQADTVMCERPCGRGYVKVEETPDMPWPGSDGGVPVHAAHEFHYSKLVNLGEEVKTAYKVLRGEGIGGGKDGVVHGNLLASFVHLRAANSDWVRRFADFVEIRGSLGS